MFWGHFLSNIGTLKRHACVRVLIKIRLIPLRSNISIPRETLTRQPDHIYSKSSQQARDFITSKGQKYREGNRGDEEGCETGREEEVFLP